MTLSLTGRRLLGKVPNRKICRVKGRRDKQSSRRPMHSSLTISVTRCLDYLFNIWLFTSMTAGQITCPKAFIFLPKWRNFAKSGHSAVTIVNLAARIKSMQNSNFSSFPLSSSFSSSFYLSFSLSVFRQFMFNSDDR